MTLNFKDWLALFILSLLWGGSFFFAAIAVTEINPILLVFFRVSIACIALGLWLKITGVSLKITKTHLQFFLMMGLLNNIIPFGLIFWSQIHISASIASILNATTPVFSMIVAHQATKDEKLSANKMLGLIISIIGVIVLIGVDTSNLSTTALYGMIACLTAALSYGLASVYGRKMQKLEIKADFGAFGQLLGSTLILLPVAFFIQPMEELVQVSISTILSVLALAIFSTAIAYLIYFKLIKEKGALNASIVTILIPLSAIFLGVIFLGDILLANHIMGLIAILIGLIIIDGRLVPLLYKRLIKP